MKSLRIDNICARLCLLIIDLNRVRYFLSRINVRGVNTRWSLSKNGILITDETGFPFNYFLISARASLKCVETPTTRRDNTTEMRHSSFKHEINDILGYKIKSNLAL